MELNYIIAGLRIRLRSSRNFTDCGFSLLFSGEFSEPDCLYDFSISNNFPAIEPKFADGFIGYRKTDVEDTVVFYETLRKTPMYSLTKTESGYSVLIPEEKYLNTAYIWNCLDLPGLFLDRGRLMVHSSFIIKDGEAVLFCGSSGVGKSTQASLWAKFAGAEVINGDKAVLYCENGTVFAASLPVAGTSRICINKTAPVKAVVNLSHGKANCLNRVGTISAMNGFLSCCMIDTWRYGETDKFLDIVSDLIGKVPQYDYSCLPDESAVETLCKELYGVKK